MQIHIQPNQILKWSIPLLRFCTKCQSLKLEYDSLVLIEPPREFYQPRKSCRNFLVGEENSLMLWPATASLFINRSVSKLQTPFTS